jgi:hypothetical protein
LHIPKTEKRRRYVLAAVHQKTPRDGPMFCAASVHHKMFFTMPHVLRSKVNEARIMQLFEEDLPNPNNKTHASQPFLKDNDHFFMTGVTAS